MAPYETYPIVHDLEIESIDAGILGTHMRWLRRTGEILATFPWYDNVETKFEWVRHGDGGPTPDHRAPVGTLEQPFWDLGCRPECL